MKTHSITLSPHEVRAALRGELSLVVRPVKPQPDRQDKTGRWTFCVSSSHQGDEDKWSYSIVDPDGHLYTDRGRETRLLSLRCPLGGPGDRLAGKETWAHDAPSLTECRWRYEDIMGGLPGYGPYYQADPVHENAGLRWRSPATMPAWASRITLENCGVRVMRLAEITEEDARATGVTGDCPIGHIPSYQKGPFAYHFAQEWESRYGKRYPWESSPWVWAAKVKRVEG